MGESRQQGESLCVGLLLGYGPPEEDSATQSVEHLGVRVICADVADYLEHCSPASFDAFSLSNILTELSRDIASACCSPCAARRLPEHSL